MLFTDYSRVLGSLLFLLFYSATFTVYFHVQLHKLHYLFLLHRRLSGRLQPATVASLNQLDNAASNSNAGVYRVGVFSIYPLQLHTLRCYGRRSPRFNTASQLINKSFFHSKRQLLKNYLYVVTVKKAYTRQCDCFWEASSRRENIRVVFTAGVDAERGYRRWFIRASRHGDHFTYHV